MADTYNHKIKVLKATSGDASEGLTKQAPLRNWIGTSNDKNPRVLDGALDAARLNEPNGCWARTTPTEGGRQAEFVGLYVADTGNDCIRFVYTNGTVETLEISGVPDVRSTAGSCTGDVC